MTRTAPLFTATLVATALLAALSAAPATAQSWSMPSAGSTEPVEVLKLSGPRFGVTTFTGDVADARRSIDKSAFMTQFGWQAETQILATDTGDQALIEWVGLLGGVEQGEMNLSGALIAGYRLASGFELGAGPNISYGSEAGNVTTSMLLAAGVTVPMGQLRVPLNVAVALAEGGPRITTLVGWVVGR
jgi:hypothetical protein